MPADYVLWFDARCSTSRRALELLRDRGIEPELRRWLEDPPTGDEVEALLRKLGASPHDVARRTEDEYQALRLSDRTSRDEMLRALARHPRILDGPVLVHGDRAVLARPPERVLELVLAVPAAPPDRG
jgi:arsenate reductase